MKIIILLLCLTLFAFSTTPQTIKQDQLSQYREYLNTKQTITMCVDPNWMPYEKIEKGKHIGMAADFMEYFQENIGIPIVLVPTKTWEESTRFAKERKCDIFSLAMSTPSRLEYMNFTPPYVSFPLVVATKMNTLFILNVEDIINTKTLAIVKGYAFAELLRNKFPKNKLIEVNSIQEGLQKVASGEIFGFVDTLATVGYELQKEYIGELKIAGKFDETWDLAIGVRNDDLILLDIFNHIVASLPHEQMQKVFNKWISVKFEEKTNYTLAINIAVFLLIIIGLIIYRNYNLKRYSQKMRKQAKELESINKELVKTKKKLEKSLKGIEVIYDCMLDAVFIYEGKKCVDVNEVAVQMFGYDSKDEMKGLSVTSFAHIQSLAEVQLKFKDNTTPYEVKGVRKNGTVFPALAQGTNITLNGKKVRVSVLIDISEIKNKEKLLVQQTKLASMGEMIGNIAHQWRQPLNIISTTATGMKLQLEFGTFKEEEAIKELDTLNETVQHLSKTIDDFRNFFKSEKEKKLFSVEQCIKKNLKLLEGMFKIYDITVIFEKVEEFTLVNYENEFIQAMLNIFYNAKDALENKTHNKYIFINIYKKDNQAIVSIKDNGGGIRSEAIGKIFEPYFTTKYKSNGTGIGLYMTHQIIQDHMEGKIEAENVTYEYDTHKYKGAIFTIKLPLS
jgi:PAS domain S-box-containing protein